MLENKGQSDEQHFHIANSVTNEQLEKIIFPRMITDEISLVAKKDQLTTVIRFRY